MHGHLVIADISGYTRFLTETELEHSNGILSDLLNAIISSIQAPLQVSNIEGDAVFMYGVVPEGMIGQTVVESVESLYYAFASTLESMVLNTTCQCNACANIHTLGLKIVMHCGDFVVSEIGGRETVTGPAVVATHRLLKNQILESTGISDYMFVTQECVDELALERMVSSWVPHQETYEDVGEVAGYVNSLADIWQFLREQNQDKVLQRDAWLEYNNHIPAPVAVVWDHMIDPVKRNKWLGGDETLVEGVERGRIETGVVFHCAHGDAVTVMAVTDAKPLDYMTILMTPEPEIAVRYTDYLVASGTGTRIISYVAPPFEPETGDPLSDEDLAMAKEMVNAGYEYSMENLVEMTKELDEVPSGAA